MKSELGIQVEMNDQAILLPCVPYTVFSEDHMVHKHCCNQIILWGWRGGQRRRQGKTKLTLEGSVLNSKTYSSRQGLKAIIKEEQERAWELEEGVECGGPCLLRGMTWPFHTGTRRAAITYLLVTAEDLACLHPVVEEGRSP